MSGDHATQDRHEAYMFILRGIQESVGKLAAGQQELLDRVASLEQANKAIIGNGQPGRLQLLEQRTEKVDLTTKDIKVSLASYVGRAKGALWVLGSLSGVIVAALGKVMYDVIILVQLHKDLMK